MIFPSGHHDGRTPEEVRILAATNPENLMRWWIALYVLVTIYWNAHHGASSAAFSCSFAIKRRHSAIATTRMVGEDPLWTEIPSNEYSNADLPNRLAYPHFYEPHPIAILACDRLRDQIQGSSLGNFFAIGGNDDSVSHSKFPSTAANYSRVGKMLGVLVVRSNRNNQNKLGYLKAYSGTIPGITKPQEYGFCPSVYDRLELEGFFKRGEAELNSLNRQVQELENGDARRLALKRLATVEKEACKALSNARMEQKANKKERGRLRLEMQAKFSDNMDRKHQRSFEEELIQQSNADQRRVKAVKAQGKDMVARARIIVDEIETRLEALKALRKQKSRSLQNQLFTQYQFLNANGEKKSLLTIFSQTALKRPPSGAGDCVAPKLFQYAYLKGYQPVAMAEFWWGNPPAQDVRKHNFYYPACRGKCEPILDHMLKGLDVEDNPLEYVISDTRLQELDIETLFEDEFMVVVNKPHGMLSVPGRFVEHSVYTEMKKRYPNATGPLLVHRLDMSTSGILIVAKDKDTHKEISAQFISRSIKKRYTALLEGEYQQDYNKTGGNKGLIDLPLTGDYLHRPMQKVDFANGKPALTYYEIVEVLNGRTRVHFYPLTGRTHQLRVHAAHRMGLNISIAGDDIYGQRDKRMFLHASFLQMTHPVTKQEVTFVSNTPF